MLTGLISSLPGENIWRTTFARSLTADSASGFQGFMCRQLIGPTLLTTSGNRLRLTLQAGSADPVFIGNIYIGEQAPSGNPYDMDGGQVHVFYNGAATFTVPSGGSLVTDPVTFPLDITKTLIVSYFCTVGANSQLRRSAIGTVPDASLYSQNNAGVDEASVSVLPAGYNISFQTEYLVNKIEVLVPA